MWCNNIVKITFDLTLIIIKSDPVDLHIVISTSLNYISIVLYGDRTTITPLYIMILHYCGATYHLSSITSLIKSCFVNWH